MPIGWEEVGPSAEVGARRAVGGGPEDSRLGKRQAMARPPGTLKRDRRPQAR